MDAPLYNSLKQIGKEQRFSFAMPGHKGRTEAFLPIPDMTETYRGEDLHHESPAVSEANQRLAKIYGARRSFILSGGSTTAVRSMMFSCLKPGDTVLISEDCHMSVIHTAVLLGLKIGVIQKEFNSDFLIPDRSLRLAEAFERHKGAKAVIITSPSYYGICADIKAAAKLCAKYNALLLVDEAHGAHFPFSPLLPQSAAANADMVCQSAHKTLNALTGAAYLHVCSDSIDAEKVRECINIFETSSPSYPIAASADIAASTADGWSECVEKCRCLRRKISDMDFDVLENDDATRLVICFSRYDITGFDIEKILAENYDTDVEMADLTNIVLIVTPSNTDSDFERLLLALGEIKRNLIPKKRIFEFTLITRRELTEPRESFFAEGEITPLRKAEGKISKSTVVAYPPGTPIIICGERITAEQILLLRTLFEAGAKINGMPKNGIETVK